MGGSRSSSKRKGKRDKISSKKKSRRKESKKRRRSYDSVSSSSDDDSLHLGHSLPSTSKKDHRRRVAKNTKRRRRRESSLSDYSDYRSVNSDSDSDSSSTDENDYKVRKARRSRVGLKDIKRKGRKRSISSIGDVDTQSGRKRKRLGKDHDSRPIKKSSKKKSRKVLSSSSESDSKSCSASQSRSSSTSGDDKRQRNKVVADKKKERLRRRGSGKGKQKHIDRSPSCTSIDRGGDPSVVVHGNSDGEFFPVYNSRRLKSVITVVDYPRDEEESRWEKDPNKEEIVYDQNDYPSPRSVDSNEGGSKMESGNQSNVAFSDRICFENIAGDEVREPGQSRIDDGDRSNAGDCQSEGGYIKCFEEKEIDMSVPVASVGGDVLESILRQKALENLKKFRKMPKTSPRSNMVKINNETNMTRLSDGTVDIIQNDSIEQGISDAQEMNQRGELLLQREIAEAVKLPDSEHVEEKPRMDKLSIIHSGNAPALLECSEEDKSSRSRAVEAKAVPGSNTSPGAGGTKACSSSNVELTSSVEPTPEEHSSEKINEVKDGSEFEQKTMSVMRGGELVQVNYKVYIPKKAPALARRHLRR